MGRARRGRSDPRAPRALRDPFGTEAVAAREFSARVPAVADASRELLARLGKTRRPVDLLGLLCARDDAWCPRAARYRELQGAMEGFQRRTEEGYAERRRLYARRSSLKARRVATERAMGVQFRTEIFEMDPGPGALARRGELQERRAGVLRGIEANERALRDLLRAQGEAARDPEIRAVVDERRELETAAEIERARLVREAVVASEGLEHAALRPSAWWLPLVSPDGAWFPRDRRERRGVPRAAPAGRFSPLESPDRLGADGRRRRTADPPLRVPRAWEAWLAENHGDARGIWLAFAKKATGIPSVTYAEALDVALCWGWIDGQRNVHTDGHYLQRFTPRRARSLWSKRNVAHVARLTEAGRMRAPGLAEVEVARADGRLDAAYDAPSEMVVPEDFLAAVAAHPVAQATFDGLRKSERYSIAWRLATVKTPRDAPAASRLCSRGSRRASRRSESRRRLLGLNSRLGGSTRW